MEPLQKKRVAIDMPGWGGGTEKPSRRMCPVFRNTWRIRHLGFNGANHFVSSFVLVCLPALFPTGRMCPVFRNTGHIRPYCLQRDECAQYSGILEGVKYFTTLGVQAPRRLCCRSAGWLAGRWLLGGCWPLANCWLAADCWLAAAWNAARGLGSRIGSCPISVEEEYHGALAEETCGH